MLSLIHDLRYALRQLRKTPGMAVLAILTLALGIGANTAIFTVIQNVLLRPLPYPNADRIVSIAPKTDKPAFGSTSWLNYVDIRNQSRLLQTAAGYSLDVSVVQSQDSSISVAAPRVTPNLFSMLGVKPILGRTFNQAEGQTGGPNVAILNEGLWRESFHADPNIIGKTIRAGGISRTVIGVLPASFQFPEYMGPDATHNAIWFPLQPTGEMLKDRGYDFFNVIGELRSGATVAQYQHELDAIAARVPRDKGDSKLALSADPYQELVTGPVRPVLYALFAALGLVLLIACANVSNLLIARCLARQQEFAVRAALGAGRMRLVSQMLAEGIALSILGCALGLAFAQLSIVAIHKLPQGTVPRADTIAIHWTVVFILAAIATLTTVLSSLLPGLLVARANPQAALQAASRGLGSRTVSGRLSGALVAGEVALSAVLLVGAGLLFHTLWNLEQANLGIDIERVTTFTAMPADAAGFSNMSVASDTANAPPSVATLVYAPILDRMRTLPGVQDAALVTSPPFSGTGVQSSFEIVGQPKDRQEPTRVSAASAGYARVLGTPMVRGRMIADSDTLAAPSICVVNDAFAKKYFPGKDPDQAALGHQVNLGGKDTGMIQPYTIVGVMADQVGSSVGGDVLPNLLLPLQQVPTTSLFYQALLKTVVSFVVKTRGDIPIATTMRDLFRRNAPGYALDEFQTMQQAVEKSTFSQRLGLYLVGSFAALAIAMVIAGLYGVLSQLVSYRRREIGVRMALGATRSSVATLVLRQGSILVGAGLAAGLIIALATGRLVASFLYQVKPLDAWTYAAVILALALVGLLAALLPARKAASIQPMQALREE
ncbi:MAG TPA: ABC transporter permease [Terracidiphilus sp.]|jgi:predicted permease|nr:ABC transporter permease [Terracidiphilus sp.]